MLRVTMEGRYPETVPVHVVEETLTVVMDELTTLDDPCCSDPVIELDIAERLIRIIVEHPGANSDDALIETMTTLRSAFHAAELGTPGWPTKDLVVAVTDAQLVIA